MADGGTPQPTNRSSVPNAGGNQDAPQPAPGSGNQQQIPGNNDVPNDTDVLNSLWDVEPAKTGDTDSSQQQTQQQQSAGDQLTPAQQFEAHIEAQDFAGSVNSQEMFQAAADNDVEGFNKALQANFKDVSAKVYKAAVSDVNRIMDAKIETAVSKAVEQSTNSFEVDKAVTALNQALPFTTQPMIAPVAKGVLGQFMKKGSSLEDAIEGTRKFFTETNKLTAKDLRPTQRHGQPRIDDPLNFGGDDDETPDWMEMLTDSGNR